MVALAITRFEEHEYLALEAAARVRHEFCNGLILAMAGAEPEHNQIVQNLRTDLELATSGRPCRVSGSDQRVKVEATGEYFYPDVIVVCSDPRYAEPKPRSLLNPEIVIEVLSASTASYDRGDKARAYRMISSLTDYLMVSSDRRQVEHVQRTAQGWSTTIVSEGAITLASGAKLELTRLYRLVELPG